MKISCGLIASLAFVVACSKTEHVTVGRKPVPPSEPAAPTSFRLLPGAQEGATGIAGRYTDLADVAEARAQREGRGACESWAKKQAVPEGLKLLGVDFEVLPAGYPECEPGTACLSASFDVKCIQVVGR